MADTPFTQAEKAERFHALHQGPEPFILANAFDAGSARILAGLGFEALGTTSGGFAGTLGRCDARSRATRPWTTRAPSWMRSTCRFRPIWRTVSAMNPRPWRKP